MPEIQDTWSDFLPVADALKHAISQFRNLPKANPTFADLAALLQLHQLACAKLEAYEEIVRNTGITRIPEPDPLDTIGQKARRLV